MFSICRKLAAYFSASGVTAKVAESLSDAFGADLFEIVNKIRYTKAELDWRDKASRSTIEMNDPPSCPEIESLRDNVADYDDLLDKFMELDEARRMQIIGFDPYPFVALVNKVVVDQDRKLEIYFRKGMKYEYTTDS